MPIRDVEEFFPALNEPPRVLANRGANGIDGTVSSAFGVAAAGEGEVVLLLGDVTLAHDIGGLLAASRLGLKLTIVLAQQRRGGIFNFLAVASEGEVFERHIATPTGLDFAQAAVLYSFGTSTSLPRRLRRGADRAIAGSDSTIIEVRTDRVANRRLHADVEATALVALRSSGREVVLTAGATVGRHRRSLRLNMSTVARDVSPSPFNQLASHHPMGCQRGVCRRAEGLAGAGRAGVSHLALRDRVVCAFRPELPGLLAYLRSAPALRSAI